MSHHSLNGKLFQINGNLKKYWGGISTKLRQQRNDDYHLLSEQVKYE